MELQSVHKQNGLQELFLQAEQLSSSTVRDKIVEQLYKRSNELIKDGSYIYKNKA